MTIITLEHVQQAAGRCLQAHPAHDNVLPPDAAALAELLGQMFYRRVDSLDTEQLSAMSLAALSRWSQVEESAVDHG